MKLIQLALQLKDRLFHAKHAHSALKPYMQSNSINKALQQRERVFFLLAFAFFLIAAFAYFSMQKSNEVLAAWYDGAFQYRQRVNITNAGSAQTDYQVAITLDTATLITAGKMQSNCADIRITSTNGKQLPYWIETGANGCNTAATAIWTKIPTLHTSGNTVYVYYGNSSAISAQDGDKVFTFFDDFSGSTIDSTKWTQGTIAATSGTDFAQTGGNLTGGNTNRYIQSVSAYTGDYIAESRVYETTAVVNGFSPIGFYSSSGNSFGILSHNGTSYYRNDAGWTNFAFNGIGQWSRDKVKVVGTSATYWRTGETTGSPTASTTNSGISAEYVRLSSRYDNSANNQNYVASWDWILVRKAAATEPTVGSPTAEEQAPGPVAYWKFDEGYGTSAKDSTGKGKTGTFLSAPIWKTEDLCVSGKCLAFDNVDDGVSIANENFTSLSNYTMCAWVNPKGNHKNYTGTIMSSGDWNNTHWAFGISQTNTTIQTRKTDGVNSPSWSYAVPLSKWTYICITRSNTTITAYANGTQIGSPYTGTTGNLISNATNTTIGRETYAGGYFAFNGLIDEPQIYPYARSAAQIKQDFISVGSAKGASAVLGASTNQGVSQQQLSNGLVGYWKMDEASWTNDCSTASVLDASGNGNNGKACPASTGSTGGTVGKFGNGGSFDGSDDYADIADSASLDIVGDMTIGMWVKPGATQKTYADILSKHSNGGYVVEQYSTNTNQFGLGWDTTGSGNWTGGSTVLTTLTANTWQYFLIVKKGAQITNYLNGVQTATGTGSSATVSTNNLPLRIGNWASTGGRQFNGSIDEVRIYNRALSPTEVRALYSWAPGPVAYYNFDEGTGTTTTYDRSGNGNNGTMNGSMTTSDWVQGKYGKALDFDGTDDYVSGASNLGITGNAQFTMCAWIKWTGSSWSANYPSIMGNNSTGTVNQGLSFTIKDGKPSVDFWNNRWRANNALNVKTWYYLCGTKTPGIISSTTNLYVNGTLVAGTIENIDSTPSISDAIPIVGRLDGTRWFQGIIDDAKFYNYARTPGQIIEDMNAGHPIGGSPVGSEIGYWKFDEGTDNTCLGGTNDVCNSGSGGSTFDGAQTGMAVPATATSGWSNSGKFGKGLKFDGSNDAVTLTLQPAANLTYSIWIKPTAWSAGSSFIGAHDSSSPYNINHIFWSDDSTNQIAIIYDSITAGFKRVYSTMAFNSTNFPSNTWTHLAVTIDGTNVKFYKNGSLVSTAAYTTPTSATSSQFAIGRRGGYASAGFFNGQIDEVKYYNTALTEDQIKIDYNHGTQSSFGSASTESDGTSASNSSDREYCIPGDTSTCSAPIAEWKMDEATGGTANDSSGNGNTGTWNGSGTRWTNGKIGKAGTFQRSNLDYISAGTNNIPSGSSARTFEGWINPLNNGGVLVGTNAASGQKYYLQMGNVSGTWYLFTDGVNGANNITLTGSEIPPLSQWSHIAFTLDGSNGWKYYLNGTYIKGGTFSVSINTSTPTSTYIGNRSDVSGYSFDGKIDQVRIYNYARTPAQVAWDYNKGAPVALYKLDECQGLTAHNAALNANGTAAGNDGTITIGGTGTQTSAGTCSTNGTAWGNGATGKWNASLNFDGTDDSIGINGISSMGTSDLSVSAWVKSNSPAANTAIISNGLWGGGRATGYGIIASTSGSGKFTFEAGGYSAESTTSINSNWQHVVGIRSGNNIYIYVNGVLEKTTNTVTTVNLTFSATLNIAQRGASVGYYSGQIDDARIYNYALTALQVKQLYNQDSAVRF
ncbi:MAG: DUF2341 domain-containing protein [Candidatus Roizmanbacteria bacterium]|nr:DUF2341 domain-containing protein [Candidatus Roizmanbacteria bacterium]